MTKPYKTINGNCIDEMKKMDENSIDAIVCDPPYGLSFMSSSWDKSVPGKDYWIEALRVLKPGGHLLAFSGSRTYHHLASAIEDSGFEIRDQILWIYGSGFPKSMDIGKAIDKSGAEEGLRIREEIANLIESSKLSDKQISEKCNVSSALVRFWRLKERNIQSTEAEMLKSIIGCKIPEESKRKIIKQKQKTPLAFAPGQSAQRAAITIYKTAPASSAANQWDGWGTALKPAHEPIVLARKPFKSTVAENILKHGTGGLNIEACRIQYQDDEEPNIGGRASHGRGDGYGFKPLLEGGTKCNNRDENGKCLGHKNKGQSTSGETFHGPETQCARWPANLIHDGSDEARSIFPQSKGQIATTKADGSSMDNQIYGAMKHGTEPKEPRQDIDTSAARFFYCAKASKSDREEGLGTFAKSVASPIGNDLSEGKNTNAPRANTHPTVKPTELMRHLCKLITPPGGLILDPFMGSGSTGKAAIKDGFRFVGIELDATFEKIAAARIEHEHQKIISAKEKLAKKASK